MTEVGILGSGLQNEVRFPSGQITEGLPGANLLASLSRFNATFGFNNTPHQFNLSFVPQGSRETIHGASGEIPNIDTELNISVGSFAIKGFVTHADYSVSNGGTTVEISLSDRRRILSAVSLTTDDIGSFRPSGVVSVPAELRRLVNFSPGLDRDPVIWEYRKILEQGANYSEIYAAIENAATDGIIDFDITKIPHPEVITQNTGGADAAAIRFKFDMTTLDDVIDRVLKDSAYDWYWNMAEDKVAVVNRKIGFTIDESDLFTTLNNAEYKTLRFGQDAVGEPSRVRMLGARKQGFWNSRLLSPIDGIDLPSSGITFTPAWTNITVQFIDAGGNLRSYKPTDLELKMALAGEEQWSYFKIYQTAPTTNDPPGFALTGDAGSIAAQHPEFQSRLDPTQPLSNLFANPSGNLRLINNRRDATENWAKNYFNRVNDHANRHFGRSYVASGILYNQTSGLIEVVETAWANIENQIEGFALNVSGAPGPFVDGYQINKMLGPVSPFIQQDFRVSAHAVLPSSTLYGPVGEDPPASFGNWSEDVPPFNPSGTNEHYIPARLSEVGQRVVDPRDPDNLFSFQQYPDGTVWCQFPTIVAASRASGTSLDTLSTIIESVNKSTGSGEIDFLHPTLLITPYDTISGIAIPVQIRERYGDGFPDQWVSGTVHPQLGEQVAIDEQYAPWNFFPAGNRSSTNIMDIYAKRKVRGLFIDAINSRYAEIQQPGFPVTSFDTFASQTSGVNGLIGERNNGIASITFSLDATGGFVTTYRVNDFYSALTREAPLGDRKFPAFLGPITPIDFDIFDFDAQPSRISPLAQDAVRYYTGNEAYSKRVEIKIVNHKLDIDVGTTASEPERYFGDTQQGVRYPNPGRRNFDGRAMSDGTECVDGFLDIDDEAVFHYEEQGLQVGEKTTYYYFTGGHPIQTRVATISKENDGEAGTYDITFPAGATRTIRKVPPLNNGDNVVVGNRTTLLTDKGTLAPKLGQSITISSGSIFLQTSSSTSVIRPVEITAISDIGTSGAFATVKELSAEGILASGQSFMNVVPIPFRHFATVGMRGLYLTHNAPSGSFGQRVTQGFVMLPIHGFGKFE